MTMPGGMPPMPSGPQDPMGMAFESPQQSATPVTPPPPAVELPAGVDRPGKSYPAVQIKISEEKLDEFKIWLDTYIQEMQLSQQEKQKEWVDSEAAYRAKVSTVGYTYSSGVTPSQNQQLPFIGSSTVVVPVIAMAVDPIHARLDTGIFKQDPVIKLKGLKKSVLKYIPALEEFIDFNQRHRWKMRSVFSPRILECAKLGTMFFRTEYEVEEYDTKTYDAQFNVVKEKYTFYKGPKIFGISSGDILFPAGYQYIQDSPIIIERVRSTLSKLRVMQAAEQIQNVKFIASFESTTRSDLENALEDASSHHTVRWANRDIIVERGFCDYDIDGDGLPEKLAFMYHYDTRTMLSLRYNWYFNQRKPYTAIPYTIANGSIYGLGICEMVKPFQDAITQWERMASDNAYIANIRMFIVRKGSNIEEVPRLYAGRCFFVEEPTKDFIPFQGGDIYPSTLSERQNLFGLVEKRTGVSDYLTGRESPIIGTRATATSTLALIQEGTKRVEQVLENIRLGIAEIIENCFDIWIQYGVDGIDEIVFSDDEIGRLVKEFFDTQVTHQSVRGAIAIDLSATDASGNRQVQQQLQLSIIQLMMGYYAKLLEAGGLAMKARAVGAQPMADLVLATSEAAKKMFTDLLHKYDIRNPDDYIPDLADYINQVPAGGAAQLGQSIEGPGAGGGSGGPAGNNGGRSSVSSVPSPGVPALPGSGDTATNGAGGRIAGALAGASGGT